ncbi:MAG: aspartate aminotransferase family protein, partial [Hyphomicrobiales bacterium]|nr:aspartate aminotransferase family protein [Hyphomicrobiales bacterium]
REKWLQLADHPLVGEARISGMMGAIELVADKAGRRPFEAPEGTIGLMCREHCFANGLVMRHVGDKMIISPPLIISKAEIDELVAFALKSLDDTLRDIHDKGLMKAVA